ncbi:aspartyl/asparaginyl beta-hydroxylase domain-containing protein [Sphingomonas sp.]|uniref:aspartyl/asparaginyl beta-hydroxylase domain-containing protein n=1 Tax=Sphingomonas sp. TaxID=28214 RepID=UPI0031CDD24F
MTQPLPAPALSLLQSAQAAADAIQMRRLLEQALAQAPGHPILCNAMGMSLLAVDPAAAASWFERAIEGDADAPPLWMNLATARRDQGDPLGERDALQQVLTRDQRHVMANVRMAEWHDRAGEESQAQFRWHGVATVLQSLPERSAGLDQLLAHALDRVTARARILGEQLDAALAPQWSEVSPARRRRFDRCVDAMLGRRAIYTNACHGVHFPFLPADEFFDPTHFPWFAELEAATPVVRAELEALLRRPDSGFAPYVTIEAGTPENKWTALDQSEAWSARYLWRYGVRDPDMAVACPHTMAMLEALPMAHIPGKGPTAFFSVLKPGTRLPAHTGVSNVRAIVHLPLIVPPNCGFRVGGETRDWVEGHAFAFDDTIEHEAWNDSAALRAVLIFDTWNPHLTLEEQAMLQSLFAALGRIEGGQGLGAVAE